MSVEKSEHLSDKLKKLGVPHTVLNAKMHADEAKVVAIAGHKGSVTVATNMAGRGTDIMLGGSVDFLADAELRKLGLDPVEDGDAYETAWPAMVEKIKAQVATEHDEVRDLGGLYVVGTERHESRRIDNQLRGRSGRQGDPGESRFYLSLQDELMRLFKSDWVDRVLQVLKIPDDVPIENKRVTGAIANAQGQVESQNFESRKNVLKYDDVMDRQRQVIYDERRGVLEGADLQEQIRTFVDDVVTGFVTGATQGFAEEWDLDGLWTLLKQIWPVGLDLAVLEKEAGDRSNIDRDKLIEDLKVDAHAAYERREAEVGEEVMRELERRVILSVLDRKWREHLYEMDYLREGIDLRAYSQRDPLVEYQREGFEMFAAMMDGIKEESVGFLFNLEVQVEEDEDQDLEEVEEPMRAALPNAPALRVDPAAEAQPASAFEKPRNVGREPQIRAKGLERPKQPQKLSYSAPAEDGEAAVVGATASNAGDEFAEIGRNQLCPCGSGKKYKRCHGAPGGPTGLTARITGSTRVTSRASGRRTSGAPRPRSRRRRTGRSRPVPCRRGRARPARAACADPARPRPRAGPAVPPLGAGWPSSRRTTPGRPAPHAAPAAHPGRRGRTARPRRRPVAPRRPRPGPPSSSAITHDLVADGAGDGRDRLGDRVGRQDDHPAALYLVVPPGLLPVRVRHGASLPRAGATPVGQANSRAQHTQRSRRRSKRAATARERRP